MVLSFINWKLAWKFASIWVNFSYFFISTTSFLSNLSSFNIFLSWSIALKAHIAFVQIFYLFKVIKKRLVLKIKNYLICDLFYLKITLKKIKYFTLNVEAFSFEIIRIVSKFSFLVYNIESLRLNLLHNRFISKFIKIYLKCFMLSFKFFSTYIRIYR